MQKSDQAIPVFFSCDDRYLPFLAVSIRSLIDNLSPDSLCNIHILNNGLRKERVEPILQMANERVNISLTDVGNVVAPLMEKLNLRDYYTVSIYFRLFIASLFPQYEKAIYLDADITVNGDITKLYETDLGDRLVAAVSDDIIAAHKVFTDYSELALGIPYRNYFNSGVMLMNLTGFRQNRLEEKFVFLLNHYHFETICPDQDYLNVLCRGRVLYLNKGWNKMSLNDDYRGTPDLIHYNMFFKPWQYDNVCYASFFWNYAKRTPYYEEICKIRSAFGWKNRLSHQIANRNLHRNAKKITQSKHNFRLVLKDHPIPELSEESVYEA